MKSLKLSFLNYTPLRLIKALIAEFNVNEHRLRTGENEMYSELREENQNKYLEAFANSDDPLLKNLTYKLTLLSSENLKSIHDIVESLTSIQRAEKNRVKIS